MSLTKEYLIALKSLPGIGTQKILKIGNYINDCNIIINEVSDLVPVLCNLKIKVNKKDVDTDTLSEAVKIASAIINNHAAAGIGITTYYDDDFPTVLRKTINEDGKSDPPVILYYKGNLEVVRLPQLAVIGTREITSFGENAGKYLTTKFCDQGFCIVSGLALGCDTVAHRAALESEAKTIAFLAHGLDMIYPAENAALAQEILDNGGLLFSEYPIGTAVNRYNLVARDRLQAGLANATLVIQTGIHGGTMHAANTTLKAQKPLYVIKFRDEAQNNHDKSLGNKKLADAGAHYISGDDALNLYEIAEYIKNYVIPKTELF